MSRDRCQPCRGTRHCQPDFCDVAGHGSHLSRDIILVFGVVGDPFLRFGVGSRGTGSRVSWRSSSPVSRSMTSMLRSAISRVTRVPASSLPRPMWCSRLSWRRVTLPASSTVSWRTRWWGLIERPGGDGLGPGGVDLGGGVAFECPVRSHRCCSALAKRSSWRLEFVRVVRAGSLGGEPFLLGLLESFDLAAGLRMVGRGSGPEPDSAAGRARSRGRSGRRRGVGR